MHESFQRIILFYHANKDCQIFNEQSLKHPKRVCLRTQSWLSKQAFMHIEISNLLRKGYC